MKDDSPELAGDGRFYSGYAHGSAVALLRELLVVGGV